MVMLMLMLMLIVMLMLMLMLIVMLMLLVMLMLMVMMVMMVMMMAVPMRTSGAKLPPLSRNGTRHTCKTVTKMHTATETKRAVNDGRVAQEVTASNGERVLFWREEGWNARCWCRSWWSGWIWP